MNLFIAGHGAGPIDEAGPNRALADLLSELPFIPASRIETWRAPSGRVVIVSASHDRQDLGGVDYRSVEPGRAALFAGRPVRWRDGRADGHGPLDASSYCASSERWADELDGRCTVVRADAESLEVYADPLGAYPAYEASAHGCRWFSNSAVALRLLAGDTAIDEEALGGLLAGGWSLGGHPVWRVVRRLDRGVVVRLDARGERRRELLPLERIASFCGAGLDVPRAADDLVQVCAALAQWPGRPDVLPLTGGRDSRLVFAAALAAGFRFEARTGGEPSDPDVVGAARLAEIAGVPHAQLQSDPGGDRFSDLPRAARLTTLASGGTATLADGAGFPMGPRPGPLPLWHSGQGGEIARAYYGSATAGLSAGGIGARLYARFAGRRAGRPEIVSEETAHVLRARVQEFAQRMLDAGAAPADVPDLFYLLERMAGWAAPAFGVVETVRDTTSPLWTARMLPHLLGLPAEQRALERFHLLMLQRLAPQLVSPRFADGSTWPAPQHLRRRVQRARVLTSKASAELRRRAAARRAPSDRSAEGGAPAPTHPFDAVVATVREASYSQPQHLAWAVLDRTRVQRLLGSPAASLDEMSRYYVWRLGTVFLGM